MAKEVQVLHFTTETKVVCPCGCGSFGRCFIYGDDVPTGLELVYARVMNRRLSL